MEDELFVTLLKNFLQTNITKVVDIEKDLIKFEEDNCLINSLQPASNYASLKFTLPILDKHTIYEIKEPLGTILTIFEFKDNYYIVGPYLQKEYNEKSFEKILIENKLSTSLAIKLRLFLISMPIVYTNTIVNVVNNITASYSPNLIPYRYRRVDDFMSTKTLKKEPIKTIYNYEDIYKRYDAEHKFMHLIESGDKDNINRAFSEMANLANESNLINESDAYSHPIVYFSILRVLARKAAEASGLSVITIDEITKKHTQLVYSTNDTYKMADYTKEMIIELTSEVHNHLLNHKKYPKLISDTIEYIYFHLSEDIKLDDISKSVHASSSYLSKYFKQKTGIAISEYIMQERCKKAASLLAETNYPIQEISSFVGYMDNNYFVKVFKKIYHQTPSQYRNKAKDI